MSLGRIVSTAAARSLVKQASPTFASTKLLASTRSFRSRCFTSGVAYQRSSPSKGVVNLDGVVHRLQIALSTEDSRNIRDIFTTFLQNSSKFRASPSANIDHRKVIITALERLAKNDDAGLLERIFNAAANDWGLCVDLEVHAAVLRGLCASSHHQTAFEWLRNLPSRPGGCDPTIELWNDFLTSCVGCDDDETFWKSISLLRASGVVKFNLYTYRLIFTRLVAGPTVAPPSAVQAWVDHMEEDGLTWTRNHLSILMEGYAESNTPHMASTIERMYLQAPHAQRKDELFAGRLASTIQNKGDPAALKLLNIFKNKYGFVAQPSTLDAIAGVLSSYDGLHKWERRLRVRASSKAWESLLANIGAGGDPRHTLPVYRAILDHGHTPTAAMLHPVLRAICAQRLRPPSEIDIARALELFRNYIRLTSSDGFFGRPMPRAQQDITLYNTLLRPLIHSQSTSNHAIAVSLVEELLSRGIVMDNMTTTAYLILLMKVARNITEAYKAYQLLHKGSDGKYVLDQKGYIAVLNAYCKLSDGPASVEHYMTMIKDMRAAGHSTTAEVYTILLQQMARWTKGLRGDETGMDQLIHWIEHVHHTLSLDPTLSPDTALWNQLMDTYQRARCFGEAFTIWQTLFASKQFNHASISIFIDACAFSGTIRAGRDTLYKVCDSGFALNENNWIGWLECLCRHRQFEEAIRVLCIEMPQRGKMQPTRNTMHVILRFAKGTTLEGQIHHRLKSRLPELYSLVISKESKRDKSK